MPTAGEGAPDFTLPGVDGEGREIEVSLSGLRGRPVVLYFYPKDDTPGCTTQACGIRDAWPDFGALDAVVLGVSADDLDSHRKFQRKFDLPFTLLADADTRACRALGHRPPGRNDQREDQGFRDRATQRRRKDRANSNPRKEQGRRQRNRPHRSPCPSAQVCDCAHR